VRIDGYKWSTPFSVSYEGVMRVSLKKDVGDETMQLRIAVRSGAKKSRFEVVFRLNSLSSPYRFLFYHYPPHESSYINLFLYLFNTEVKENSICVYPCIFCEKHLKQLFSLAFLLDQLVQDV
jgi:hypothetical protein